MVKRGVQVTVATVVTSSFFGFFDSFYIMLQSIATAEPNVSVYDRLIFEPHTFIAHYILAHITFLYGPFLSVYAS